MHTTLHAAGEAPSPATMPPVLMAADGKSLLPTLEISPFIHLAESDLEYIGDAYGHLCQWFEDFKPLIDTLEQIGITHPRVIVRGSINGNAPKILISAPSELMELLADYYNKDHFSDAVEVVPHKAGDASGKKGFYNFQHVAPTISARLRTHLKREAKAKKTDLKLSIAATSSFRNEAKHALNRQCYDAECLAAEIEAGLREQFEADDIRATGHACPNGKTHLVVFVGRRSVGADIHAVMRQSGFRAHSYGADEDLRSPVRKITFSVIHCTETGFRPPQKVKAPGTPRQLWAREMGAQRERVRGLNRRYWARQEQKL